MSDLNMSDSTISTVTSFKSEITDPKQVIDEISQHNSCTNDSEKRLSFVQSQENLKQLFHRTIYIDSMRTFLLKVKHHANFISNTEELELLLVSVSCIDLTTLSGDDTSTNVERLCYKAAHAIDNEELDEYKCAAVCVYPARVVDCLNTFRRLRESEIRIAAVATGFPSGQYGLKTRIAEVKEAIENGANEIDVVINRAAAIAGDWAVVYDEVCEMRQACDIRKTEGHLVRLKVIVAAGDLLSSTPETIYTASLVAILAGANFIKTSTGKETINATLCIGYIMMRCIADYYYLTGVKIGFKPAGGIRTHKDALNWLMLTKLLLGPDWLEPRLFRFGASGLLNDIERRINHLKLS